MTFSSVAVDALLTADLGFHQGVEALLDLIEAELAVVCPAYPENARTVASLMRAIDRFRRPRL